MIIRKTFRKKKNRKKLVKASAGLLFFIFLCCILLLTITSKYSTRKNSATTNHNVVASKANSTSSNIDSEGISDSDNNTSAKALSNKSNFTVCIDAGHGGYDNGTKSSTGILEKNVTLSVALKLGKLLEKKNIKVIYTRTSDNVPWPSNEKEDLRARVKISNDAKADVFVSIHCNGNDNFSYKGSEVWCRFPNSDGENLAKSIEKELSSSKCTVTRGIKYESVRSLAVLKLNNSVSTLVELGFLTNSTDANFLSQESGQNKCAEALLKGILQYKNTYKK